MADSYSATSGAVCAFWRLGSVQAFWFAAAERRQTVVQAFLCPERHGGTSPIAPDSSVVITFPVVAVAACRTFPAARWLTMLPIIGDLTPGAVGQATDFYWGGRGTGVIISSHPKMKGSEIVPGWEEKIAIRDIKDGTSNTVMVGEPFIPAGEMTKSPYNGPAYFGRHFQNFARIGGPGVPLAHNSMDQRGILYSFGSDHDGVVQFALATAVFEASRLPSVPVYLGDLCNRSDGSRVNRLSSHGTFSMNRTFARMTMLGIPLLIGCGEQRVSTYPVSGNGCVRRWLAGPHRDCRTCLRGAQTHRDGKNRTTTAVLCLAPSRVTMVPVQEITASS
jgi:hypothetical protein